MIADILASYGFQSRSDRTLHWGCGALYNGHYVTVKAVGKNRYAVRHHYWCYNCEGDPLADETTEVVLYGAQMLQFLIERTPAFC